MQRPEGLPSIDLARKYVCNQRNLWTGALAGLEYVGVFASHSRRGFRPPWYARVFKSPHPDHGTVYFSVFGGISNPRLSCNRAGTGSQS